MLDERQAGDLPKAAEGFDGTQAETLAIWEADAEKLPSIGSPWRPSDGDTALYRRLAGSRLGGRVLVLGVTPELRDAVAEAGGRSVVVDMSPGMHASATRLLRCADPTRETWIHEDWFETEVAPGEFDLVLGDMVWWGISVRRQYALRDMVHRALKRDGLLVSRVRLADRARAKQSPSSVLASYLRQLDGDPEHERVIRGAMYSWLYDHTADGELKRLDRERAHALVLRLAASPQLSPYAEYLRGFAARLPGPNWTSQSREELLDIVCTCFEVEEEGCAEDYDASFYPVIALRPV
jgi:hypothetical protein